MSVNSIDIDHIRQKLQSAFNNNSEVEILELIKQNSFLLYELYSRKYGIQPAFHEISFGGRFRCDFAWLNDNSDGPEWVLVEIEKPRMKLFTKKKEPSKELNHAIEQVLSWQRYFEEYPDEKKRIFGAVSRFRYILVAGHKNDWHLEDAIKWRKYHNNNSSIEIRSSNIFLNALNVFEKHSSELWSFFENQTTKSHKELKTYWQEYTYLDHFRKIF
ncbi:Shedu anti-phage system protein SduA domain-containing protein [Acinetobacter guillouiae]|uniref:Shedu anti-phage system protein SduA domain-containing protein n=1 Tax=Acinetobacter guillouiae TaxID=106649 RepID=UPI003AF53A48